MKRVEYISKMMKNLYNTGDFEPVSSAYIEHDSKTLATQKPFVWKTFASNQSFKQKNQSLKQEKYSNSLQEQTNLTINPRGKKAKLRTV